MTKRPNIKPEEFVANPLINSEFKIEVLKFTDTKAFTTDAEQLHLPKEYELEREKAVKVYTKSEHRLFVSKLSPGAKSLFLWLIYEVEAGKDYLWINKQRYMEENSIASINTYKTAVDELSRYLFIYPSLVKDVYWINPRLFFCGNRVAKYKNHIVQYKPKKVSIN